MSRHVSLAPQAIATTSTACIRFAVLSGVENLHILLEHFYDSQRNEIAARSQDLLNLLRQFERRIAVVRVLSLSKPAGSGLVCTCWGAVERDGRIGCVPPHEVDHLLE
jgi:hypothetical protein